jgi:lysozyme
MQTNPQLNKVATPPHKTLAPAGKASVLAGLMAASTIAAAALIPGFEGKSNRTYLDPVAIPTDCYGHTDRAGGKPVGEVGTYHTDQECLDLLAADVQRLPVAIAPCIHRAVPLASLTAFVSFSYNIGPSQFCHSTVVRKLNAGDLAGACAGMSAWTYARGRQLPGLVNRRKIERAYCERGLQ